MNTSAGIIVRLYGARHRFCGASCRDGFRQDRAMGLIYGPYIHINPDGSKNRLSGPGEASMLWKCCAYCNARLTRARARS